MKTLVVGLDCAAPELLFGDERLSNFRRLMEMGCYGRLESIIPPITVPAWMCMATSQDPGSLGVYGFRNRIDHTYKGLGIVNSRSISGMESCCLEPSGQTIVRFRICVVSPKPNVTGSSHCDR